MLAEIRRCFEKREEPPKARYDGPWPLDLPLVHWSERKEDTWTLADACQNVLILGEVGSGKTSGSGKLIARKFLQAGMGGIVLCYKLDEADSWRRLLKDAGREQDGVFFSVDSPYRFNPLQYEANASGSDFSDNVVHLLNDIAEVQRRSSTSGGDNENQFFRNAREVLLTNAIRLMVMAGVEVCLHGIYRMIKDTPDDPKQAEDARWQDSSLVFDLLDRASRNAKRATDWVMLRDFWLKEMPGLPPVTRNPIYSGVTGMLYPIVFGKIGELFCFDTNITPDAVFEGKVIVVDVPMAKYREAGQFAGVLWSLMFMRAVERRRFCPPNGRPVFQWMDECQYYLSAPLVRYLTTSRGSGGPTVMLTQTVSNFLQAYGHHGKHAADAIMGLPSTKIFHLNGDPETNKWAAEVIAKDMTYRFNVSGNGQERRQVNLSEHDDYSCAPHEFMGLRSGGARNNYEVEAVLFQSGRLWKGKRRWIVRRFKQK